jgi:hypothetical protein
MLREAVLPERPVKSWKNARPLEPYGLKGDGPEATYHERPMARHDWITRRGLDERIINPCLNRRRNNTAKSTQSPRWPGHRRNF